MNLVGYLRVSTAEQADNGHGLDVQRDTIEAWARQHRHKLHFVADAGKSGSNGIEDRLALAEALELLTRGAEGIVVANLHRLARDLIVQEQLLAEIKRRGARVFSCADGENTYIDDDEADPSRTLIRQILGAVAQYERAMIRLRMQAGQARKAAAGGYAYGAPPYGWAARDGSLIPVPHEQAQIDLMRAMRTAGSSYREIAAMLTKSGARARRGQWHPSTIQKVLRRDARRLADAQQSGAKALEP